MADETDGTPNTGTPDGAGGDAGTSAGPNGAGSGATSNGGTLILGKYKSHADLEKAHLEQERILSQKASEAQTYRQQLEELHNKLLNTDGEPEPEAAPAPTSKKQLLEKFAEDPEGFLAARERAIEQKVLQRFGQTEEQISRMEARAALAASAARHSDFGRYQDSMVGIARETGIRDPERLYQLAKYPDTERALTELTNKHRQEIETLRAQAFADGGGIPTPTMSKDDEKFADSIVAAGRRRANPFL